MEPLEPGLTLSPCWRDQFRSRSRRCDVPSLSAGRWQGLGEELEPPSAARRFGAPDNPAEQRPIGMHHITRVARGRRTGASEGAALRSLPEAASALVTACLMRTRCGVKPTPPLLHIMGQKFPVSRKTGDPAGCCWALDRCMLRFVRKSCGESPSGANRGELSQGSPCTIFHPAEEKILHNLPSPQYNSNIKKQHTPADGQVRVRRCKLCLSRTIPNPIALPLLCTKPTLFIPRL